MDKMIRKMKDTKLGRTKQNFLNSTSKSLQTSMIDDEFDSDEGFWDDPEMEFKMWGNDLDYITVIKKDKLEKIDTMHDRWPCLWLR